jgi:hypothetical protein
MARLRPQNVKLEFLEARIADLERRRLVDSLEVRKEGKDQDLFYNELRIKPIDQRK